jgi:hypothetical protein
MEPQRKVDQLGQLVRCVRFFLFIFFLNFLKHIDGLVVLNAHVSFRVWEPAMAGETSS